MRGRAEAWRERHNMLLWHAWHAESFARVKKLPRKVPQIPKPRRPSGHVQNSAEVFAVMKSWVAYTARRKKEP